MATGAAALIRALERAGAGVVFGVAGAHNLPLVVELRAQGVRFVAVQSPDSAVLAATGHAGRTGRLSVAVVGPSASPLPLLDALEEARGQGAPVLVVDIAPTPRPRQVRPGDQPSVSEPLPALEGLVRQVVRLHAREDVTAQVKAARDVARTAPGGPVVLHVPPGFLGQEAPAEPEEAETPEAPAAGGGRASVEHVQLRRAANLVDQSQNVLLWAGGGALRAGAGGAVAELAEKVGAPVITTVHSAGLLPARHPCLVGLPPHMPAVGALWDGADLVIGIGTDFDDDATQAGAQPPPRSLIAINIDAGEAGRSYRPDVLLRGDARTLTKALADTVSYRGGTAVVRARLDEIRSGVRTQMEAVNGPEAAFVGAVSAALPDRATVVTDPCTAGRWLAALHEWTLPRTLWFPDDLDRIGVAVPVAVGAAAAGSTEPVVAVVGDQGLLANLGELGVLAREKLPVTLLVVDDGGAGRLRGLLDAADLDPAALDRRSPDFAAIARSFGLRADAIDVIGEELTGALRAHIAAPDPTMLVVRTRLAPPPTDRQRWYRPTPMVP